MAMCGWVRGSRANTFLLVTSHNMPPRSHRPRRHSRVQAFPLLGLPKCKGASRDLAEHHKVQLQSMGTYMDESGSRVLNLHGIRDLLDLGGSEL